AWSRSFGSALIVRVPYRAEGDEGRASGVDHAAIGSGHGGGIRPRPRPRPFSVAVAVAVLRDPIGEKRLILMVRPGRSAGQGADGMNTDPVFSRRERWGVLFAYTLVVGISQMLWLNFAPLLSLIQARYGVSELWASLLVL